MILKDIIFGIKNLISEEEIAHRIKEDEVEINVELRSS